MIDYLVYHLNIFAFLRYKQKTKRKLWSLPTPDAPTRQAHVHGMWNVHVTFVSSVMQIAYITAHRKAGSTLPKKLL